MYTLRRRGAFGQAKTTTPLGCEATWLGCSCCQRPLGRNELALGNLTDTQSCIRCARLRMQARLLNMGREHPNV
jgi:hypothetical protein